MDYIFMTCPDADGVVIEIMNEDALLKRIEEKGEEGQPYRFLDKIPNITNGQFVTEPFYTEEESKKSIWSRAGIPFAVIVKGEIIVPD